MAQARRRRPCKAGFTRFIRREPIGLVFTIAALAAGNAVLLKHSAQTPLCAEHYTEGLAAAGLPDLAWTGGKDSGRGCTLSTLGYGQLTRPKSYHLGSIGG